MNRLSLNLCALLISVFSTYILSAQKPYTELSWRQVATGMHDNWYGSEESLKVAENVLLYQRDSGGWPKNIEKHKPLSEQEKSVLITQKKNNDAIFDNSATTTEMRFLARMYAKVKKREWYDSYNRGLNFILDAQYENGGWPMFWPLRKGYYTHITFNDNAIVNILSLLSDIDEGKEPLAGISSPELSDDVENALQKGISIILKTQIIVEGKPTVWCAQHDEKTLMPAKARSYELPSFSGGESAGIVKFLMSIRDPSHEVIRAVEGAAQWFEDHKIVNLRWEFYTNSQGQRDRRIVTDPSGKTMWARFYDLETGKPFFCDRDGIKKNSLDEIGHERRNGYSWYTDDPEEVLREYPDWNKKWNK